MTQRRELIRAMGVTAPDRGGITEYANPENSYLAPPTAADFAEAIVHASQANSCTAQKLHAARKTAEALAWPKVGQSFLDLYQELHRVSNSEEAIEAAQPAFICAPAKTARAGVLRLTARIAGSSFLTCMKARHLLRSINFRDRVCSQTKLGDIRTQ